MTRILHLLLLLAVFTAAPAQGHELWIEPEDFTLRKGQPLSAHIFIGETFEGAPMSWFPDRIARAEILLGETSLPITSRLGDRPAIHTQSAQNGLGIIVVETTPSRLTYREWARFEKFVAHKDFPTALQDHRDRGLPETGFTEIYTRHVKSLVAFGDGKGSDRQFGLETEIIALTNPYTDDISRGVPVQVLYLGEPRADAQVEVFEKAGEDIEVFTLRTDPQGKVMIPVKPAHSYLLDAVVLRDTGAESPAEGPVWETLWAGLTFRTP